MVEEVAVLEEEENRKRKTEERRRRVDKSISVAKKPQRIRKRHEKKNKILKDNCEQKSKNSA